MSKKVEYTFGARTLICFPWLLVMGFTWFLWFFLLGNFYALIFGVIPVKPELLRGSIYADDLMYNCVLLFSYTGMILSIVLGYKMVKNYQGNASCLWYTKRVVLRSIALFGIFMVTNLRFSVQFAPQLFGFTDIKKEYVTNTKLYFFWVDKLGFDYVGFYKFQTLDDTIQGLKLIKNSDDRDLYTYILYDMEKFGYEEVFKKYDDTEFQKAFLILILQDYHNAKMSFLKTYLNRLPEFAKYISNIKLQNLYKRFYFEYSNLEAKKLSTEDEIKNFQSLEESIRSQL